MKTNHLLTVFVALALLAFGCGKDKKKSKKASEPTTESAAPQPETPAEAEKRHADPGNAKSASGNKSAAEAKPAPAAKPAVVKAKRPSAPARKVPGSLNIMDSPRKGPAIAKVTIMEISDFQ